MRMATACFAAFTTIWLADGLQAQTQQPDQDTAAQREAEIQALRQELATISARLSRLEAEEQAAAHRPAPAPPAVAAPAAAAPPALAATRVPAAQEQPFALTADDRRTLEFFRSTTIGINIDGYYTYNFNSPIGQVNLLRAYDVSSNSFSLNQADLIFERLPTPESRYGGRIDLMFGQATDALQGSTANEQRPQVWRNLFQAYGSYLAQVGSGLQLDFGKFASPLGNEGNYTKDQIAYSRGFLFDYLPSYHEGLRASYNVSPKLEAQYLLVNGIDQTEDFNGFKSQGFIFDLKPASTLSWNINYYFGEEARGFAPTLYPGIPTEPTQPGLPTENITPTPNGRQHIFDSYATWQATPKLKLVGEADYVINRNYTEQQPGHTALGAFEFQYELPHDSHIGGRTEYFDDRSGLFSGTSQALKEVTLVADRTLDGHFLIRAEYRRDFSNRNFFLTSVPDVLAPAQTTATMGLVFWWGTKEGSW